MQWEDRGIILSTKRFGESSALVTTFTQAHGKAKGLLKGGFSKSKRGLIELGNVVDVRWTARLEEQLGQWTMELIKNPVIHMYHNHESLLVAAALCEVCSHSFAEGEAHKDLYELLETLLTQPTLCDAKHYVHFEIEVLRQAGFALKLDSCVVTGQGEDLCYVSPKSGAAVSRGQGKPYESVLFPLPEFIKNVHLDANDDDLATALTMTSHFLKKHVWSSLTNVSFVPFARNQLFQFLVRRRLQTHNEGALA